IGFGAIGSALHAHLQTAKADVKLVTVLVTDVTKHAPAAWQITTDPAAFLATGPDLIVECAGQRAFAVHVPNMLAAGYDVIAASAGALADEALHRAVNAAAQAGGAQLFVPAGALAGIDALAGAMHAGLTAVRYARTAPPATWVKAGVLSEAAARALTDPVTVFDGNAREAAQRFPKNANVAATLALAGIGFERTRVELIADPAATGNTHAIEAHGAFGTLRSSLSTTVIPGTSTSRIVPGSLAQAVVSRAARIVV
ncbi:MAG TPA: aspartate dehydrogenase, partial [Burkholderiales bacterium]|nr:aspartate dehydrogenase [Burkholderiales bacterium]